MDKNGSAGIPLIQKDEERERERQRIRESVRKKETERVDREI